MKLSTVSFRKKRTAIIKNLIKFKDNEDKYVEYLKELQKLYIKYKIKKYQSVDIVDRILTSFLHNIKLKTLNDIETTNQIKKKLMISIEQSKIDIEDLVEKMKLIFLVLEGNKKVVEEIQEEIKFIKNVKEGICKRQRGKGKTFKLEI